MIDVTAEQLLEAARDLATHLFNDVDLCTTRQEHIRVTSRANAAAALYNGLSSEDGPFGLTFTFDSEDGDIMFTAEEDPRNDDL